MRIYRLDDVEKPEDGGQVRLRLVESPHIRAYVLSYPDNQYLHRHAHRESDEVFCVMRGSAEFTVEGSTQHVEAGEIIVISPGEFHQITTGADSVVMVAIVAPNVGDFVNGEPQGE